MTANQGATESTALSVIVRGELHELAVFAARFTSDLIKSSLIIVGLLFFSWLLHLARLAGSLDEKYINPLEMLDFCASYATYLIICLDFIFKLCVSIFRRRR